MEELAFDLKKEIDNICGGYHYYKDENVIPRAKQMAGRIAEFCAYFLNGNIFRMEESEYQKLQSYVTQVLEDYMEALQQDDLVFMLDTLDYGLRELLDIYG